MADQWGKSNKKVYGSKAGKSTSISFSSFNLPPTKSFSISSNSSSSSSSSAIRPASNENEPNTAPSYYIAEALEKDNNVRKKKREPVDPSKISRPRKDSDTSVLQDAPTSSSSNINK